MKILLGILSLSVIGCANVTMAPPSVRQKAYTIENKNSKYKNFDKAQLWAATVGGQMSLNDRKTGDIVLRANKQCSALKMGNGYAIDQKLWFTLIIKAEDKRVDVNFTGVEGTSVDGWDHNGFQPSSQEQMNAITSSCLEPVKSSLESNL